MAQLIVNDGVLNSSPDTVLITAQIKPGDLDHDGDVDNADNTVFRLSCLGKCQGSAGYNPEADYDKNGCVTFADYNIWSTYYRAG